MGDQTHGEPHTHPASQPDDVPGIPGQIVLVLQGGGALGAYQAGVYEALHDAGVEPQWVIGTSIGAINGAIIAGNRPANRMARLTQFWNGVARHGSAAASWLPGLENWLRDVSTVTQGVPSFFTPQLASWTSMHAQVRPEEAAFYSTGPLRETLLSLVDFDYLNEKKTRLTVGTVNVQSGRMRYFTNRDAAMEVDHVMASAAFPPGFPSVQLEGESYWDGGIYSNTPLEAVLDDRPRRDSVIFSVQLWPSSGPQPESILQVMSRQRDIQYSSRAESHLDRQKQIHRLRHVIRELGQYVSEEHREAPAVQELLAWGCGTTMQVLELDAPAFDNDDLNRDIDFSASGIKRRWLAGYEDTARLLKLAPWRGTPDPMEGISVFRMASRSEP
ncbi:patatin-like phospholipase family protein [Paraburkholderia sp. BCC1884]|uniref:patatin-like phospholipase family protein n=1 Tax=Paraburkholderia sp. BCC1884 TaxID=2562668 RepID=UPI0011825E41|nr:patatin-like phospholipase family protein [Paraburkholderia sp. BCC1884]